MPDIARTLNALNGRITNCQQCPRLVSWREQVAVEKRASFREDDYWGRPVPGFGDPEARLLIVGLAPRCARGKPDRPNVHRRPIRRMALSRAPPSRFLQSVGGHRPRRRSDIDRRLESPQPSIAHPPDNKPTPAERDSCQSWLLEEMTTLLPQLRVIVALGGFAWNQTLRVLKDCDLAVPRPPPEVLASVRGEVGARGGCCDWHHRGQSDAARVLPPFTAEHLHRAPHGENVRRGLEPGGRVGRAVVRAAWRAPTTTGLLSPIGRAPHVVGRTQDLTAAGATYGPSHIRSNRRVSAGAVAAGAGQRFGL